MRRGDIVTVAAPGDYGKPRPAVVVQADALTEAGIQSAVVCLLRSQVAEAPAFRITVAAGKSSGLEHVSQIMVDKILAVPIIRVW